MARKYLGEDVVEWMKANVHPLDIVFRLAEDHGIVLLNGSGFAAPDWSVRISFANLDDHVYDDIGRAVRAIARGYRQAYEAATGKSVAPAGGEGARGETLAVSSGIDGRFDSRSSVDQRDADVRAKTVEEMPQPVQRSPGPFAQDPAISIKTPSTACTPAGPPGAVNV